MDNHIDDLSQWITEHLPNAIFAEVEGEIVIHTGLTEDLGGYLYPVKEEENV